MSSTFVTLAEVLEARGGPLQEEEVWSLLLGSAEALVDVSYKGNKLWATSFFTFMLINVTVIITTATDWDTVQISPLFSQV